MDLEEERRLAYVGITRAKKKLLISFAMNRFYQGNWIDSMASRFIEELPEKNIKKNSFFDEKEIMMKILNLIKILKLKKEQEVLVGLDIKKELNDKKKNFKIKKLISNYNLDGYIIPKNDAYFSEFASPDRLKIISNFSGSAGFAIILKKENFLFVDGRYTIQAQIQCW